MNVDSVVLVVHFLAAALLAITGEILLYAGVAGFDYLHFLGVGAYVWVGGLSLGWGILYLFLLGNRPHWFEIEVQ